MRRIAPLLALVFTSAAFAAASDLRPPGRFDDRVLSRVGGRIPVEAKSLEAMDAADPLRRGWEEFSRRHGCGWRIRLDERSGLPTLVAGRGIEWLAPDALATADLEDLAALAEQFLAEHVALLGDWSSTIRLDREASRELRPGLWQLVFRQVVDGLVVEDSRLDLHVNRGRLVMFGATLWGVPRIGGVPTVDVTGARAVLDAYLETETASLEQVEEPRLAMVPVDPEPGFDGQSAWDGPRGSGIGHALVWRFRFREPGEAALWIAEVDAHDGSVRALYDGAHYTAIRGGVFPISNDLDCEAGGCEIAGFPMPFADYTESAQPEEYADAFGNMMCAVPDASFETNLSGPYIDVQDACGTVAASGTCDAGIDLGLKAGENCESVSPEGVTAAARSAYYHLNRAAEVARFYDQGNTWLRAPVTVNVNTSGTCNAFWNGEINMYGGGNGCGNTGEQQGVLVHEWGHGYDENDGGGFDVTSEAYADVVAIFASRDSCMSRGWYNDGRTCSGYGDTCLTCTGIRDHDWAARVSNTPATPTGFLLSFCPSGGGGPCNREAHCESYVISEAIFDLATRDLPAAGLDQDTAWQLAERLWYVTRPGSGGDIYSCFRINMTNSCGATHWFQRMLVADDDDGDLSNGTPHAAALFAAFDRHDIACGSASDPENQSTSSCPALAAPQLSVTIGPSGPELAWAPVAGAAEYRVYRGDLGCDRQQVPIASLAGTETSYVDTIADPDLPAHYRIEAFTANVACHSPVSNCETTPVGARLQKNGHDVVEDPVNANGDGNPDPGETLEIPVRLFNSGSDVATGVSGRVRMTDSTQGRVIVPDATWADVAPSAEVESDAPHFGLTLFENAQCGQTLHFTFESQAANDVARTSAFQVRLGDPQRDFVNDQPETIPPMTTQPVTSTLVIDQDLTITELDVSVRISHDEFSEVIVELTAPDATTVRLHDQSPWGTNTMDVRYDLERQPDGPGTMDDFVGKSTLGTWALSVEDVGPLSAGDGTLYEWTLHFSVAGGFDCAPWSCPEATPTEAVTNLTVGVSGADLDLAWDPISGVAGYHVLETPSAAFDSGVELAGKTTTATTLNLPGGAGGSEDLTFFQVRAINACNQEGP